MLGGLSLLAISFSTTAAVPNGYYDDLEGKSGVTLKKAVKSAARSHTVISYGNSTWSVFLESDTRIVGGQRCWWDMYSNNNVPAPSSSSHSGMNIEHSVANSWWGGTKNDAYNDLMHLNPSNSDANSRKSNYPLGEVGTQTWSNGATTIGRPTNGTGGNSTYVYEPCDEYKGDFARVFFYMFTIYDDISWKSSCDWMFETGNELLLKKWAYDMLLKWAEEDPVSQKEIDRNEAIFKHQKNRNPFIDYPELAEHIWGTKKNVPFHLDGSTDPDPDPDPDIPDVPVDPDPVPSSLWYAVTSSSDLNEQDKYILVSTDNSIAMSYSTGGSGSVSYLHPCKDAVKVDKSSSPASISIVPDEVAVLHLTRNGASWMIEVTDLNGNSKGYLSSSETKKVALSTTGTPASITTYPNDTEIVFGSIKGNLQYNNQENGKRFTTYTSSQESVMLYRLEEEQKSNGLGTGLPETADEVIYGIYDINGRKMAAESISELERGIYIVISNFGSRKIMK